MTSASTLQPARRFVSNRDESCRMFRTDFFERLSHVHPTVPHILYLPVIAVMLWIAGRSGMGAARIVQWVVAGLLMWTFTEYVIHRFIFHPPQWIEDDTRRIIGGLAPGTPTRAITYGGPAAASRSAASKPAASRTATALRPIDGWK